MRTGSPRNLYYKVVFVLEVVAGLIFVAVSVIDQVDDPEKWRYQLGSLADAIALIKWIEKPLAIISAAALAALEVLRRRIRPPWALSAIHEVLDVLWELAFEARASGSPAHYHRVTLFKKKKWRIALCMWPWSGWLVPIERSGILMRNTRTAFRAPDSGKAEGVAGQAWIQTDTLSLHSLPIVNVPGGNLDPSVLDDYYHKTWTDPPWLTKKRRERAPRSFVGMTVETTECKKWGVILLDSRDPDEIPIAGFDLPFARVLGKLIDRS